MAPIALWDFSWLASNALIMMLFVHGICIHFFCVHDMLYEIASSLYVGLHTMQYNDEVNTMIGGLGLAGKLRGGGGAG